MVLDFKKNKVVLSVLPWTCWLVSVPDVGWAVLACMRLLGCVEHVRGHL